MRVGRSAAVMCVLAATAMAGQSGPILPVPIIDQDEAALSDLSYFSAAAIGELTGDGVADLLVTRRGPGGVGSGQLSVYQGDGAGGLVLVSRLAIGGDPTSVLLEDMTGDGRVDALITDGATSTLSIYAQRDAGRFELLETITTGRTPVEAALADVTGDGVADLLVCNYDHYFVGLHEGVVGGGFEPVVRLSVGLRPADMEVIDVDGDGDLDVLTADELSGTVSLLENEAGVFASAVVAIEVDRVVCIAAADLDGDGAAELVVCSSPLTPATIIQMYVLRDGVFVPDRLIESRLGDNVSRALLEDIDGDGFLDLLLAGYVGAEMYSGVVGGLAETAQQLNLAGGTMPPWGGVSVGRLTQGGPTGRGLDMVFVGLSRVAVAFAADGVVAGPAGLWAPRTIDGGPADARVVGQFTDDGLPDVLVMDDLGSRLWRGMGGGEFAKPVDVQAIIAKDLLVARLRPGELDDAIVVAPTLQVLRPDGVGGFARPIDVIDQVSAATVGDVDGDGHIDVVVGGTDFVSPLLNDGTGTLIAAGRLALPSYAQGIAIGDLTGDGVADVVVAGGSPSRKPLFVAPGEGGGAFGPMLTIGTQLTEIVRLQPIDVGDLGQAVLVVGWRGALLVRHFDRPSPTLQTIYTTDDFIYDAQVLDVDGDGRSDVVFSQSRSGTRVWLQGDGATFEPRLGFGWWGSSVELVEATGDGRIDALLGFGLKTLLAIGKEGRLLACPVDLDGDGRLTLFDFLEFQTLFAASDPAADFDGDGALTVFDFLHYQNLFELGCP